MLIHLKFLIAVLSFLPCSEHFFASLLEKSLDSPRLTFSRILPPIIMKNVSWNEIIIMNPLLSDFKNKHWKISKLTNLLWKLKCYWYVFKFGCKDCLISILNMDKIIHSSFFLQKVSRYICLFLILLLFPLFTM